MNVPLLSTEASLFALNVAVASVVLAVASFAAKRFVPRLELPSQHCLLCVALVLILVSPLTILLIGGQGLGIVQVSLGAPDNKAARRQALDEDGRVERASDSRRVVRESDQSQGTLFSGEYKRPLPQYRLPEATDLASDHLSRERTNASQWPHKFRGVGALRWIVTCLAPIWCGVAVWLVVRLVRGLFVIRQLLRSLQPTTDSRLLSAARRASRLAAEEPGLSVCETKLVAAPSTLGWWRSVILIPEDLAASLNDQQLLAVVAHEAAHVARRDTAIAMLQSLAGGVFWWNPLLRRLNRQISQLRDQICDDYVVELYGDGLPLAEAIVKVAEWSTNRNPRIVPTVAFLDHAEDIEQRISRLAEQDRTPSIRLTTRSVIWIGTFAVASASLCVPFVRGQVDSRIATDSEQATGGKPPASSNPALNDAESLARGGVGEDKADQQEPQQLSFPITVTGRAIDDHGNAIIGAKIYLAAPRANGSPLAITETGRDGVYRFSSVPLPIEQADTNSGRDHGGFEIFGEADGHGFAWRPLKWFYPDSKYEKEPNWHDPEGYDLPTRYGREDPIKLDLKFGDAARVSGRVMNASGEPIANTKVALRHCDPDWRQEKFNIFRSHYEFESLNWSSLVPPRIKTRRTDEDGRFEFDGLPANHRFWVDVRPPGHPPRKIWVVTHDGVQADAVGNRIYSGDFQVRFATPRKVKLQVIYGDCGEPAPKVGVGGKVNVAGFWETSDENGFVEVPLPDGSYELSISPRYGTPYLRTEVDVTVSAETVDRIVIRIRPAAVVNITVVDADSGNPLPGVDVWLDHNYPESDVPARMVHGYRSWEVDTRISHYERPRTDDEGKMRVLFEPGRNRFGVGLEAFPDGYEPLERDGKEIDCQPNQSIAVEFQMRRRA